MKTRSKQCYRSTSERNKTKDLKDRKTSETKSVRRKRTSKSEVIDKSSTRQLESQGNLKQKEGKNITVGRPKDVQVCILRKSCRNKREIDRFDEKNDEITKKECFIRPSSQKDEISSLVRNKKRVCNNMIQKGLQVYPIRARKTITRKDPYTKKILDKKYLVELEEKMRRRQAKHFKEIELIHKDTRKQKFYQANQPLKKESRKLTFEKELQTKQKRHLSKHVRMIKKALEESGDGSTFEDVIDFSKEHSNNSSLLVLHALSYALLRKQIQLYQNLFVRTDCLEDYIKEQNERKRIKIEATKTKKNKKIPLLSSLKKYRKEMKKKNKGKRMK